MARSLTAALRPPRRRRRAARRATPWTLDAWSRLEAAATAAVRARPVRDALRVRRRRGADLGQRASAGRALVHTIRAVGAVTRALLRRAPGDVVGVRGPFGDAPGRSSRGRGRATSSCVAGGIGLAPLRPGRPRRCSRDRERYGRVSVLYGGRSPRELLYTAELERWRGRFDVAVEVTVDAADAGWRGRVGVVTTLIAARALRPRRARWR